MNNTTNNLDYKIPFTNTGETADIIPNTAATLSRLSDEDFFDIFLKDKISKQYDTEEIKAIFLEYTRKCNK